MAWLLVLLLALAFAIPIYAGIRLQRPAKARSTALVAAAMVFVAISALSGFSTWAAGRPDYYGEHE